jgi:hypothetical protein
MSLPAEIKEPTERLLKLLQSTENVSERTIEQAGRLLRPMPTTGLPDYVMALKLKLKQSIMENANSTSSGSMSLASFEKECERLRKINPALLQSALILMEPMAFSNPKSAAYFTQFKNTAGGATQASASSSDASALNNPIKDTLNAMANEEESNSSSSSSSSSNNSSSSNSRNRNAKKASTIDLVDRRVAAMAGDVSWVDPKTERMLLRDLLYVFQGIEGKHIKYDGRSEAYEVDPKLGLRAAVRDTVLCLCELGWLYGRVAAYIASSSASSSANASSSSSKSDSASASASAVAGGKGIVVQAFGSALEGELEDYFRLLSILEKEVGKTGASSINSSGNSRSSGLGGVRLDEPGAPGNALGTMGTQQQEQQEEGDHKNHSHNAHSDKSPAAGGGLTLLRLRMWLQEPMERLYVFCYTIVLPSFLVCDVSLSLSY